MVSGCRVWLSLELEPLVARNETQLFAPRVSSCAEQGHPPFTLHGPEFPAARYILKIVFLM